MENNTITAHCPHCDATLTYDSNDTGSILCPCCDSYIPIKELQKQSSSRLGDSGTTNTAIVPSNVIDDADSALAYLDNLFETLDWKEFNSYSALTISDVDDVVTKIKIKNAANPKTWLLEFKSIIIPIKKKLEGQNNRATYLAEHYSVDNTALYNEFDIYKRINCALKGAKDDMSRILAADINFAKRFNLDKQELSNMEGEMKEVLDIIDKLPDTIKLELIPEVGKKIKENEKVLIEKFKENGIDAEATYKEAALNFFNDKAEEALKSFIKIDGYRDTHEFIKRINSLFEFKSLIEISGRRYILSSSSSDEANQGTFDVKKGQTVTTTYPSLFQVVAGTLSEVPVLRNVGTILYNYGETIFYLHKNSDLNSYNANTGHVATLIKHEPNNDFSYFVGEGRITEHKLLKDSTKFYIKRIRPKNIETRRGCFSKPQPEEKRLNNYEVCVIDMSKGTATKVVSQCYDIVHFEDNKLFYTEKHKTANEKIITKLFMVDLDNRDLRLVFEKECEINSVNSKYVVYSEYSPVNLNRNLYIREIESDKVTLLEKNIYEFVNFSDDKVFYTVGNRHLSTLFSISIDGTNRKQILKNPRGIYAVVNGWIYIIKGYRFNSTLMRVSYDGSTVITVASGVKFIVEQKDGYTYYLDYFSNLRIVRNDGKENRIISEEILSNTQSRHGIIIDDNIYCLRNEPVGETKKNYSIYKMDLTGNNVRKISFNVISMKEFDEQTIYFYREVPKEFLCVTKVGKKKEERKVSLTIGEFVAFNKDSDLETIIYSVNAPKNVFKPRKGRGCFKQPASSIEYFEIARDPVYPKRSKFNLFDDVDKAAINLNATLLQNVTTTSRKAGCGRRANRK